MHRPTLPQLRPLILTLALGVLVALFGASAGYAQTAPEACAAEPADEVSSSLVNGSQKHLALFDAYWDAGNDPLDPNSRTLINNPCPPLVRHIPAQGFTPARTERAASDVDIGHTIIHIPSAELQRPAQGGSPAVVSFKRTVTASGTDDYDGDDFAFLRPQTGVDEDGDPVYADSADVWVVPACEEGETPTRNDDLDPPFCLGFSAGLLNPGDWNGDVQYEFEAIRQPGHATGDGWGDFFVFHVENGTPNVIWRTDDADGNVYTITPGTYDHAFWAFTKPGTYVFHVQVKGHPNSTPSVGDPLIIAETVTSEVRRYTFHVGTLRVNHDPIFEREREVQENSNAGTNVGAPLCVKDLEDNTACFTLHGHGAHENFTIHGATDAGTCGTLTAVNRIDDQNDPNDGRLCAQIQVKQGAYLNHEVSLEGDTDFYDLTLQVSDGKDPESNRDPAPHIHIDDSIAVQITVTDDANEPSLALTVPATAQAGTLENLIFITLTTAVVGTLPTGVDQSGLEYHWFQRTPDDEVERLWPDLIAGSQAQVAYTFIDDVDYKVRALYTHGGVTKALDSDWETVSWQ